MDLFIVVVFQYLRSTLAKACNATPNLMSAGSSCCFEQHFIGRPQFVIMDSNIQHIENLPPVRDPSILSEEYNFHKWYIDCIKANNYGESELNCGYVKDLRGFVHQTQHHHHRQHQNMFPYTQTLMIWILAKNKDFLQLFDLRALNRVCHMLYLCVCVFVY